MMKNINNFRVSVEIVVIVEFIATRDILRCDIYFCTKNESDGLSFYAVSFTDGNLF